MQRKIIVFVCVVGVAVASGIVYSGEDENRGAETMILEGGRIGDVPFPHHRHQAALEDCGACHDAFPKTQGAIETLKKNGDLRAKKVMAECTGCHKQMTSGGKPAGPTRCRDCHKKE